MVEAKGPFWLEKIGEGPTFQANIMKLEELKQTEQAINFYCIFSPLPLPIVYEGKNSDHF